MKIDIDLSKTFTLLSEEVETWFELFVKSIPNIVVAIVVMALFILGAKIARKAIRKFAPKIVQSSAVTNLMQTTTYLIVLFLGLFVVLGILNLDKTVTSLLAGAGVIGLALGFAFQEIASNFVSGILIAFSEPYRVDDIVEVDDYFGKVTKISLRTTSIMTFDGLEVLIPNKTMFTEPLKNFTTTPKRRLDIAVGISYSDNLGKVEKVTREALESLDGRVKNEDLEFFYSEFGGSSINFDVRIWIDYPANRNYLKCRHEAIMKIKEAFDKNDITIPFPIRTIDFGNKAHIAIEKNGFGEDENANAGEPQTDNN